MGKKSRLRTGTGDLVPLPGPLHKQIEKANLAKTKFKPPKQSRDKDDKSGKFIDAALSTKILDEAKRQWREEENEKDTSELDDAESGSDREEDGYFVKELAEQIEKIDPAEEAEFDRFGKTKKKAEQGETLHDMIQQKKRQREQATESGKQQAEIEGVSPAVVALYTEIGQVFEKYRSGKVPKAFKILPTMANWEQLLELTQPERWSAAAMLQATRTFSATGTPAQCQRFNNLVMLPRLRDEIVEFKKLSFHMYQCMFKAMFKPAAFFKGILLPLCKSGTCTLREAIIFGSVLRKVSIPSLHAAAAMLSIAEMEYAGANSFILRVLIEKNYTLPFRALDGLVFHFLGMRSYQGDLPVIWHQSLLAFVERYAKDISSEQREALIDLSKIHAHHQITPEIQHLLRNAESRNEESEANVPDYAREEEDRMDL